MFAISSPDEFLVKFSVKTSNWPAKQSNSLEKNATYEDDLRLIGKRVVHFLLLLIELFW